MDNIKHYTQAPLPFIGQKRQFLTPFKQLLNQHIPDEGEGWTIIDAFGGSGLLSHVAKRIKPKARVIYNDFDGYAERLQHIPDINRLRQQLTALLHDVPRQKRLSHEMRHRVIETIEAFDGYKDPHILCAWLLFSGQQVPDVQSLYRHGFYNCVRLSDYPNADDYLNGIEVRHESFHQLLPQFQADKKALFVLDPPYLCTHQAAYKQANYFDLIDFLRLIHLTRPPYLFFSSTKSEFIRFIGWLVESKSHNWQAFEQAQRIIVKTSTSYSGKYEDNLVYRF
ncbi:DNA adenine methylase [Spirabiliibacterium pneumoniae]|uniref:DNA adenine methylase n=1 Tax=Spirabiliibacterium pneumoniae TaxID=221400 RepID=UPI001AACFFDB|nr:DNA adenine methylase [Spirabiliibacterium pneumoniae]